jgi:hypothetical protein
MGGRVVAMVLLVWPFIGLSVLVRTLSWSRTGGPARKLVPKAAGTACGYLLTSGVVIAAMLVIGFGPARN